VANASNNGLLPIGQQQGQQQQGYSQVSPMFGMYYNAASAPSGNSVLGYNMNGAMPYASAATHTGAVPTAPTGGSMAAGQAPLGNSNAGTSNSLSSSATQPATSYGASAKLPSAYSAAGVAANNQTATPPVAAQSSAAATPKYNPAGVLGDPASQAMATLSANKAGQYQGSSYKAPMAAQQQSALQKWLAGDTTYQQQLAEFNQEHNAYNTNTANTKNQIGQNFNATQRSMNNQAALDRMNQQYDFAGRGVLRSGVYGQALDQYNTQFQNNMGNLVTGENQQLTANQTNLNNFLRQLTLQQDAAKQDAISRRAAQLGITG
jgi:hypothetical protein